MVSDKRKKESNNIMKGRGVSLCFEPILNNYYYMKLLIILLLLSATGFAQGRKNFIDSVKATHEINRIYTSSEWGCLRVHIVWEAIFNDVDAFNAYSSTKTKVSSSIARAYIKEVLHDKPARFRLGILDKAEDYICLCGILE